MRTRSFLLPSLLVTGLSLSCSSPARPVPTAEAVPAPARTEAKLTPASEPVALRVSADPASAATPIQETQDAAERVRLMQERQRFLAGQYIERGDELLERADLDGALEEFASALEVMPSNSEARERLNRVRLLMGDELTLPEDTFLQEVVRLEQARSSIQEQVLSGDNAMRDMDFDSAIESYRRALNILQYHPNIADESLDERIVRGKLQSAAQAADEADARSDAEARAQAREERLLAEAAQREYRENKLRALYGEAHANFNRERYSEAEALADQILLYDPGNEAATKMRDIARQARHHKTAEKTMREYRENWIRTMEELETMGAIQTETIEFDLERWREVSERQPYEFASGDPASLAGKRAVMERLEETRVAARFVGQDDEGAPLEDVAKYLQSVTSINFIISPRVTDELDEEETTVLLDLPERSVKQLLDLITEVRENLAYKVQDGVVKFVTTEELVGGQVLRMYEVRDLIRPISDFPGREININPSGGTPESEEDLEEREALVITEDSLDSLIRENVNPESWDADPANSLRISNGTLVVNQTPEVQELIQKLLDDLREATGIMVDIQARFLKVEDNFLEDIGVDFRGLGAPGQGTNAFFNDFGDSTAQQTLGQEIGTDTSLGAFLDEGGDGDVRGRTENLYDSFLGDEDVLTGSGGLQFQWTYLNDLQLEMILTAVSKSERIELVTAPHVLVFNTARSNLSVMNQIAYVQDFDVEIAQAASIADPVISVVQDGVVLDVRPVVSADRRFITLELRPTVAELQRPIRTFTTSLGVSGNSVTIQLPELEISRVRTSIPMPDGGTVLLGGMKIHESQDLRSGVPILNKIPLISFFFERQGTFVTNRKLLILLKASIVIPTESEPTPSQLGLDPTLQLEPR